MHHLLIKNSAEYDEQILELVKHSDTMYDLINKCCKKEFSLSCSIVDRREEEDSLKVWIRELLSQQLELNNLITELNSEFDLIKS